MITLETRVARAPDPVWTSLGDESVMLDPARSKYVALNEVGTAIWDRLERPVSVAELCSDLERAFDVSHERCTAEVLAFLDGMAARGLVVVVG